MRNRAVKSLNELKEQWNIELSQKWSVGIVRSYYNTSTPEEINRYIDEVQNDVVALLNKKQPETFVKDFVLPPYGGFADKRRQHLSLVLDGDKWEYTEPDIVACAVTAIMAIDQVILDLNYQFTFMHYCYPIEGEVSKSVAFELDLSRGILHDFRKNLINRIKQGIREGEIYEEFPILKTPQFRKRKKVLEHLFEKSPNPPIDDS